MVKASNELASTSIKSVTDIFNKGIAGNPIVFISVLNTIVLSVLLIGVIGSNLWIQYQNILIQQDNVIKMNKNNELLQQLVTNTNRTNELLKEIINNEQYRKKKN